MSEIVTGLFVGGKPTAETVRKLRADLTISLGAGSKHGASEHIKVPVQDSEEDAQAKFVAWFDFVADEIHKRLKKRHIVYLHCMGGVRRSPTFAAAYLVKHFSIKSEEAVKLVKERHPPARVSETQMKALSGWEVALLIAEQDHHVKSFTDGVPVGKWYIMESTFHRLFTSREEANSFVARVPDSETLPFASLRVSTVYFKGCLHTSVRTKTFPKAQVVDLYEKSATTVLSDWSSRHPSKQHRLHWILHELEESFPDLHFLLLLTDNVDIVLVD